MTGSASFSVLGSEFDDFLFAPIGQDRNDVPLSVLSALARLDIDPWQEAGRLAQLPGDAATRRLASLIAALPAGPSLHLDPATIAARLITLLPSRTSSDIPSRGSLLDADDVTKFRAGICMLAVFLVFILASQWIAADRQPQSRIDSAQAQASSTVFPQMPPSNSGL